MTEESANLMRAIETGDVGCVQALLEAQPELASAVFVEGATPLHCAVLVNNIEIVKFLFLNGADVNAKDDRGYSPISAVALDYDGGDYSEMIETLIANGADVNSVDNEGLTALHSAAMHGKKEVVKSLLQNGANPAIKNNDGISPEEYALANDHHEIAALLRNVNTK